MCLGCWVVCLYYVYNLDTSADLQLQPAIGRDRDFHNLVVTEACIIWSLYEPIVSSVLYIEGLAIVTLAQTVTVGGCVLGKSKSLYFVSCLVVGNGVKTVYLDPQIWSFLSLGEY